MQSDADYQTVQNVVPISFIIPLVGVLVLVLDFVFHVFILCNLFVCPEDGAGCPENLTILIDRVVRHL